MANPFRDPLRSHGNVVLNWRDRPLDDLVPFAMGYRAAGVRLAETLAAASGYPDYAGYPILFLYRHAIELYLKALVVRAAKLVSLVSGSGAMADVEMSRLWKEHTFPGLLRPALAVLASLEAERPGADTLIRDVAASINEIGDIDPRSYTFRYPVDTNAQPAHSHHMIVNVLIFAEKAEAVCERLESACDALKHDHEVTAEAMYEVQEFRKSLCARVDNEKFDAP